MSSNTLHRSTCQGPPPGSTASEWPWLTILEGAGLAAAILDADFRFVCVNRVFAINNGQTTAYYPGLEFFKTFPGSTTAATFRQVRDTGIAHSQSAESLQLNSSPTAGLIRGYWSLTPITRDDRGQASHMALTMQGTIALADREADAAPDGGGDGHPPPTCNPQHGGGSSSAEAAETTADRQQWHSHALLEAMTSGLALHEIVLDGEGKPCDYRFLNVNPAFEAITGLAREDIVGRRVREILPNIESYWIERYGEVALSGDAQQFDDFSSDLNRHYRVTAYRPDEGQFAVMVDDVTLLKHKEARLRRAASVFECLPDASIITDAAATIVAVNRALTEISGYACEEVIGQSLGVLTGDQKNGALDATTWQQWTSSGFWQGDTDIRPKFGATHRQRTTITAVAGPGGELECYLVIFSDVGGQSLPAVW